MRIAERGAEREFLAGLRGGEPHLWVVAFGYEFGVGLMDLDPAPDAAPPALALRLDTAVVLDHRTGTAELRGPDDAALDAWLEAYAAGESAAPPEDICAVEDENGAKCPPERESPPEVFGEDTRAAGRIKVGERGFGAEGPDLGAERPGLGAEWRRSGAEYEAEVDACRAAIREGEAYVLCLTDTARVRMKGPGGHDPLDLYLRLRGEGAASRGGVIVAGDRALVSASPERFLSVRGSRIATHPIKGTRPRGVTPEADAALAGELAADPKERAENLMIVDLMRNDLSRVCSPGTVRTTGFLRVETHPHVHQLVSTVEGELCPGADALDAVEACFPGGSMTGAPKRRAVQILQQLEREPRGLYSGCFGWIDADEAELAMTIRSVELRGIGGSRWEARVGAGGGITIDSDPAREHAERLLKAAPLLRALGVEP
ncbi:MAG: anthranilate synthase component I family protein [Actinobacteria bacterium]|nr:anthranilate synthase component I family protein [Actinomycetota bacterium]